MGGRRALQLKSRRSRGHEVCLPPGPRNIRPALRLAFSDDGRYPRLAFVLERGAAAGMMHRQFIRYGTIGLGLNAAGYAAYLLLTHTVLGSRSAMTITYCSGVLIGFLLNRRITFRFDGDNRQALLRYIGAYAIGYAINFAGLWLFVDHFGAPHEIVQGAVMVVLVVVLFLLQRYWVFPARGPDYLARVVGPII
jgi:putative flippase GtrA